MPPDVSTRPKLRVGIMPHPKTGRFPVENRTPRWVGAPLAGGLKRCKAVAATLTASGGTHGLRKEGRRRASHDNLGAAMRIETMATLLKSVPVDDEQAWAAFERRDRSWDGRVIGAVRTTGIYCKPSCPARRPRRENVEFFVDAEAAHTAGYRPCLRCKPDEVGRDRGAVARAIRLIEDDEEIPSLAELAAAVGYAPHHFQRLFTRDVGVSPAQYARALRAKRAQAELKEDKSVTEAIYDSGYSAPSRFYADAKERLGMTPSAWRDGGRGETIRWTVVSSALGP